ncbi:MAG: hypothetical protein HRT87_04270 [Legionellales bacterium]|nr:hypothetical protein [Legionellales bacterium]
MNQKIEELNQVMADALLKIKDITESDPSQKDNFLPVVSRWCEIKSLDLCGF